MTVRTIGKNKKKIANYLIKILIEKSYIALSLSLSASLQSTFNIFTWLNVR